MGCIFLVERCQREKNPVVYQGPVVQHLCWPTVVGRKKTHGKTVAPSTPLHLTSPGRAGRWRQSLQILEEAAAKIRPMPGIAGTGRERWEMMRLEHW